MAPTAAQVLDGLVRWAIFTKANRIMRHDKNHRQLHKRRQSDGWAGIVRKDEKRRGISAHPAVQHHPCTARRTWHARARPRRCCAGHTGLWQSSQCPSSAYWSTGQDRHSTQQPRHLAGKAVEHHPTPRVAMAPSVEVNDGISASQPVGRSPATPPQTPPPGQDRRPCTR